jgi:hypothetical protein
MPRTLLPFAVDDISALARSLRDQLAAKGFVERSLLGAHESVSRVLYSSPEGIDCVERSSNHAGQLPLLLERWQGKLKSTESGSAEMRDVRRNLRNLHESA